MGRQGTFSWLIEFAKRNGWENIEFDNKEVPGEHAGNMPDQLIELIRKKDYDIIIILAGTKDIDCGFDPDKIFEALRRLWKIAIDSGAKVIACTVPPIGSIDPSIQKAQEMLNQRILSESTTLKYVFGVDLFSALADSDDGLHLSIEGYRRIGELIWTRVSYIIHRNQLEDLRYYLEIIDSQENLSDIEKEKTKERTMKIFEIFGEDWIKEAAAEFHPLVDLIDERTRFARLEVVEFAKNLEELKDLPKFKSLRKRLMNKAEYEGAKAELDVASKLHKFGFKVELYPVSNKGEADVLASYDNKEFLFEVISMRTPDCITEAWKIHDEISRPFYSLNNISLGYAIEEYISEEIIQKLHEKFEEEIKKIREGKLYSVIEEKGVTGYICLKSNLDRVRKRIPQIGDRSGPEINLDEVYRIERTIKEKHEQLQPKKQLIIVIFNHNLVLGYFEFKTINALARQIEEKITEFNNLAYVFVIFSFLSPENIIEQQETQKNYFISQKINRFGLLETKMIIKNKNYKFSLNEKILMPFIGNELTANL